MSGISCLLGTPEAQAKIRACYQTQLAKEAPAAVEEATPAVEEAPVYKATADVHPRDGVMLVKGKALLTLAEHEEYGKMTSHQILVVLTKKFKQGKGEKSQKQTMVELGMFQDADFKIATFSDLEMDQSHTVLTYTWNDSPGTVATRTHTHGLEPMIQRRACACATLILIRYSLNLVLSRCHQS